MWLSQTMKYLSIIHQPDKTYKLLVYDMDRRKKVFERSLGEKLLDGQMPLLKFVK